MSSVDDRIVNMKFNNAQFGQGVDKTRRDLTGLEKSITTAGKAKGMTTLGGTVEKVSAKFTALQVVGVTALATITNKAVVAAGRMLKSFTIQPIIDGFKEYQTNLDSIQTIMANTGKSVKTVNKYLDELNVYADQTVYNFAQMARNIGTFTAAGVRLPTATSAIKGIANLAALSGSNSQQASTAMYQLSQAIAAGRVNLQDWNSVVNAGMGGKIFQQALARTGEAFGTLQKGAVTLNKETGQLLINGQSFRNTISAAAGQESWLSGEVLVDTLKQISGGYTDAELKAKGFTDQQIKDIQKLARTAFDAATQIKTLPQLLSVIRESMGSTFAQVFRSILGDFNQSKKLFGDIGFFLLGPQGVITKIQNGITTMFDEWSKPGAYGRFKLLSGLKSIFLGIYDVMRTVAGAWKDVFPSVTGNTLFELTRGFKRFAEAIRPSEKTLKSLRSIFGGVFAVLHIGWSIVTGIAGAFAELFGSLFKGSEGARTGILQVVASVAEVIKSFDEWLTSGDRLKNGIKTIGAVVGGAFYPIIFVISRVIEAIGALTSGQGIEAIAEPIDRISNGFLKFVELVLAGLASITSPFDGVSEMFTNLQDKVSGLSGNFASVLKPLTNLNFSVGVSGTGVFDKIIQGAKDLGDAIKNAFSDIDGTIDRLSDKSEAVGDKIAGAVGSIGDAADVVKGKTSGIYDEVTGAGADAATTSMDKVKSSVGGVGDAFGSIVDILKGIGGAIGDAFGFMVEQLSKIPFPNDALDWASVLNALISGALIKRLFFSKGLFSQLKDTIAEVGESITDTFSTMQNTLRAKTLMTIAIAIGILAASLLVLSFIPAKKLGLGLGALTTMFSLLGITMFALSKILKQDEFDAKELSAKSGGLIALGTAMVLMATSVAILTAAVLALAFVPLGKLATGIGAVAVMLGFLTAALWGLSKLDSKGIVGAGAAMVLVAVAIDILVAAVLALAFIPLKKLATGLGAVGVGLAIMVGALWVLSKKTKDVAKSAASLILVAIAINMLVGAVLILGMLPLGVLAKGLGTIAIGLVLMIGALVAMEKFAPGGLLAATALLVLSKALLGMALVIALLGTLSWEMIAKGLLAMAGGLLVLIGAAFLAQFVLVGLTALGAIIQILGIALLASGAGFLMFATGLALIAAVGAAAFAVITVAIMAFIALLPNIATQMAAAFVAFIEAIALAAPRVRKAMGTIIESFLGSIIDSLPEIGKVFSKIIEVGLEVFVGAAADFVLAGVEFIRQVTAGMAQKIPEVVNNVKDLIVRFTDAVGSRENVRDLVDSGFKAVTNVLNGMADALEDEDNITELTDAAQRLGEAIKDAIKQGMAISTVELAESTGILDAAVSLAGQATAILGSVAGGNGRRAASAGPGGFNDPNYKKKDKTENPLVGFSKAIQDAAKTLVDSTKSIVTGMNSISNLLGKTARQMQLIATYQATVAEARQTAASTAMETADTRVSNAQSRLDKAQNMKKGPKKAAAKKKAEKQLEAAKKARKAAQRQQNQADAASARAELAQLKADYERQKESDAAQFKTDPGGLGDSKSQQSQDLANQSAQLAAQAQAKTDEAARLEQLAKKDQKNSKKYLEQARELRKQAAAETNQSLLLAAQSVEAQAAAVAAYAEARKLAALDAIAQMAEIRKKQEEERKQREWQEAYDKADDATKKQMLTDRKNENEQKVRDAEAKLAEMLAIGDSIAAKIARGETVTEYDLENAQNAAEEAARQAQIAAEARDAAEADQAALDQLNQQNASNNTATGGSTSLTPSQSVLEDAANAVDRYTASVAAAEEAAAASGGSPTQFVQNNYSPEALSNATIYRQTHNLISAAETQMDTSRKGGVIISGPITQT